MDGLNKQIKAARRDLERAERDYARLQHRREEIMARPARDEARRGRFIRRIDGEIAAAHGRVINAEACLEGLMSAEGE